jgi:gamma-carbonic anhydrase
MAVVRSYRDASPRIGRRVFLAETAAVIGDVVLGDDVSIWYSAVVRGDCHYIRIGARTNVQDGSVLHVTQGTHPCILEEEVTVGHSAVIHGCTVRRGALVGIGARVLDGAEVGEEAFVAAGSLVTPGTKIPPRTMWWGSPAKMRKQMGDADLAELREYHRNYLAYKANYLAGEMPSRTTDVLPVK